MTREGLNVTCICECHRIWRTTGVSFCSSCDCKAPTEPSGNTGELAVCRECNGRGTSADYVGLEMRCVEVECPSCSGTGLASQATPQEPVK